MQQAGQTTENDFALVRYAKFADGSVKSLNVTSRERVYRSLGSEHIEAYSTLLYSAPLDKQSRPPRVWGDLHLFFPCNHWKDEGHIGVYSDFLILPIPQKAKHFFHDHHAPFESMWVHFQADGIEIVIPESSFRGDLAFPWRLDFDREVQRLTGATPLPVDDINNEHPIYWSKAAAQSAKEDPLPSPRISMLAKLYFDFLNRSVARKDYLQPAPAFFARCSVFHSLLSQSQVTHNDLVRVGHLFTDSSEEFLKLIALHGGSHLFKGLDLPTYKQLWLQLESPTTCDQADHFFNGKFICSHNCGTTTPAALAYSTRYEPLPEQPELYLQALGLFPRRDGLYEKRSRFILTRVMDPIYFGRCSENTCETIPSCEVTCFDKAGFRKELIITLEDAHSRAFFDILKHNNIQLPSSKYTKGKLRKALLAYWYSELRPTEHNTLPLVSSDKGWQKDGYFDFPDQESPESQFIQHDRVGPPGTHFTKLLTMESSRSTHDPILILAVSAALAGPFLQPLKRPGICIHFFGGTERARLAAVCAASTVWSQTVHTLSEAQQNIVDLKARYQDTAMCIAEIPPDKIPEMRRLVRRILLGRKNADRKMTGIIVSSGEQPLGQQSNYDNGISSAFTHHKQTLGIDIEITDGMNKGFAFNNGDARAMVGNFIANREAHLDWIKKNQKGFKPLTSVFKPPKAVAQLQKYVLFLMQFALLAPNQWSERIISHAARSHMLALDNQQSKFLHTLQLLKDECPSCITLGDNELWSEPDCIPLGKRHTLVPAPTMRKLVNGNKGALLQFTAWLKRNKIALPDSKGNLCGVHHSPRHRRVIRGYKIDNSKLAKALSSAATTYYFCV